MGSHPERGALWRAESKDPYPITDCMGLPARAHIRSSLAFGRALEYDLSIVKPRRNLRLILLVAAPVLVAGSVAAFFLLESSLRSSPAQSDFEPLITTLKAGLSGVIVVRRNPTENPLVASASGLLDACDKNPEMCKGSAQLVDTWQNAAALSQAVFEHGNPGDWVASSNDLQVTSSKLDAWGHSYCVLRRGDMLLVLSAGPRSTGSPVCRNVEVTAAELSRMPKGRLLESPAGYFVLVTTRPKG